MSDKSIRKSSSPRQIPDPAPELASQHCPSVPSKVFHNLTHYRIVGIEFIGWRSLGFRGGIRWHSELPTDENVGDVDMGITVFLRGDESSGPIVAEFITPFEKCSFQVRHHADVRAGVLRRDPDDNRRMYHSEKTGFLFVHTNLHRLEVCLTAGQSFLRPGILNKT